MRVAGVTRGDILSHVTHVLKGKVPDIKGSGNMWHRAYRAPGRLPVMVMLIEDRHSPWSIVVRSERAVREVSPGDDEALMDAYRIVSDPPPRQKEPSEGRGEGNPPRKETQ